MLVLILLLLASDIQGRENSNAQTNVLFIIYDDLRPELSIYGKDHMVTPNFERLAKRSVVFDHAYCQIAVCNPSRGSLLTGLRPDRVNMYAFQSDFRPHMAFPTRLAESGYRTGGVGKIFHWDSDDPLLWTHGHSYHEDWYEYQNEEVGLYMNASTQPDRVRKEEDFRDYMMTTDSIKMLEQFAASGDYFMLGIGYKLPHLALHVPYRHWDMYRKMGNVWDVDKKELRFPKSSPAVAYRCCADQSFEYINGEGEDRTNKRLRLGDMHATLPQDMHNELMWAYSAAVSYMDDQLGRVLDAVDRLKLWNNLTIVLTADHGMHNGEKGLWEKWTLFDESTKVPLIISHPESTMRGQHYEYPVELIDVFPTVVDLANPPETSRKSTRCGGREVVCKPLQGQSLAPIIFARNATAKLFKTFAISQSFRCADKGKLEQLRTREKESVLFHTELVVSPWIDCIESASSIDKNTTVVSMGYSMRTKSYRYTAWYHFDETVRLPILTSPPVEEELYDHRGETLSSFGHGELHNVAWKTPFIPIKRRLKEHLDEYLSTLQSKNPKRY